MKVNNENFDKVLNKLVASTRSPRGRFTAENSWKLLESRLLKRRSMKRFWMRTASAAAVVLLCVTSWAAYQFLYVAPHQNRTSDVCGSFKRLTPCTGTKQGNTYKPEYP